MNMCSRNTINDAALYSYKNAQSVLSYNMVLTAITLEDTAMMAIPDPNTVDISQLSEEEQIALAMQMSLAVSFYTSHKNNCRAK